MSSGLRLGGTKIVFGTVYGRVISPSVRVATALSAREKLFPPKLELTLTGKQPAAVVRPVSQLGRHYCPGVSKPVLADGGSS